jgi:dihydroorotate dehydrogenase
MLFSLDAERAHDLTMAVLQSELLQEFLPSAKPVPSLAQTVFGIDFDNPVGLAAGLDKQGTTVNAWRALGFGAAEIGTVTPLPQPGNPKPRLFRLRQDMAIINRFGFNSEGAAAVARHLATSNRGAMRLGINVGRNRDTPNERAVGDYVAAIDVLHPLADYFVVNVSSPNTTGLRALQDAQTLRPLLEQCVAAAAARPHRIVPVLVKVSPDMTENDLLRSVDAALEGGAAGIIATNTTTARQGLSAPAALTGEAGGLSGAPLRQAANEACRTLFRHLGRRVPIVGVGGIATAAHAYERIRSGASLIQIYTALIYEGPGVVAGINDGLAEHLSRDGFTTIGEAIGADIR